MATVAVGLLCACALAAVSGAPSRYDQSQHGELNIHAQLDNIVVLFIPASKINLLELATKGKRPEDTAGLLEVFHKPHKTDIDRYEIVHDESGSPVDSVNDIKTEELVSMVSSQQVDLSQDKKGEKNEEKEEEVVATVQELKPESTEKTTVPTKSEATEDSPIKEQSTVSETVQESVLKVSIAGGLNDAVDEADPVEEISQKNPEEIPETPSLPDGSLHKDSTEKTEAQEKDSPKPPKAEETPVEEVVKESPSKPSGDRTIEDVIRPVAAKEEITPSSNVPKNSEESPAPKKSSEPVRLVEGARREKVIRYKPDSKWAPGLVDLLGPTKPRTREVEEKQRFAGLCAPGVWDTDLKTCIMPGDSRSRGDLARFLEAMRLGIAIPDQ